MKKYVLIFLVMFIAFCGDMRAYANEYHYTYYDYETGEETPITLTDEDIMLKIGDINRQNSDVNDTEEVANDIDIKYTLKEMSSGTNISTLSLINGKSLVKVSTLTSHYKKIVCLRTEINGYIGVGTGFMIANNKLASD